MSSRIFWQCTYTHAELDSQTQLFGGVVAVVVVFPEGNVKQMTVD